MYLLLVTANNIQIFICDEQSCEFNHKIITSGSVSGSGSDSGSVSVSGSGSGSGSVSVVCGGRQKLWAAQNL